MKNTANIPSNSYEGTVISIMMKLHDTFWISMIIIPKVCIYNRYMLTLMVNKRKRLLGGGVTGDNSNNSNNSNNNCGDYNIIPYTG